MSRVYGDRLLDARPPGLRLTTIRRSWYRVDAVPPADWSWSAYASPRSRFDSAAGLRRVRYAGETSRVAMRERFDAQERRVDASGLDLRLVQLTGAARVLDLRRDDVLDALGLDDQISTTRAPEVWAVCQRLIDHVYGWFGTRCHGVAYRSRTTPQRSANLAFFEHAPLTPHDLGPLRDRAALLDSCILSDGFAIQGWR